MIYRRNRCRFPAVVLLAFTVLFGMGCGQQKQAGPPEKVAIAYTNAAISILAHIAFANGYFAEEGLAATPQPQLSGKTALQELIKGKADLAIAATTPVMFAVMGGRKVMTLAILEKTGKNAAIIARKDRGIAKPEDLRGKRIGVTQGTSGDFFAQVFLKAHGITPRQVKIVDIRPEDMSAALSAGRIDAASTWNPILRQCKKELGERGVAFYGESLFTEIACLTAGQDYIRAHPGTIRKVLRALIKAERFASQQPAEARRLVAEFAPSMDRAMLDEMWNDLYLRVVLDQSLLVDLEDETRWAVNNCLTKRRDMPNYLDFIYIDGLQAVRPDAVRITR